MSKDGYPGPSQEQNPTFPSGRVLGMSVAGGIESIEVGVGGFSFYIYAQP